MQSFLVYFFSFFVDFLFQTINLTNFVLEWEGALTQIEGSQLDFFVCNKISDHINFSWSRVMLTFSRDLNYWNPHHWLKSPIWRSELLWWSKPVLKDLSPSHSKPDFISQLFILGGHCLGGYKQLLFTINNLEREKDERGRGCPNFRKEKKAHPNGTLIFLKHFEKTAKLEFSY